MRYYFHVDELATDEEGTELPDLTSARRMVLLAAREMLGEAIRHGLRSAPLRFMISDESGHVLDVVQTSEVLPQALVKQIRDAIR